MMDDWKRTRRLGAIMGCMMVAFGGFWLFGLVDAPTGFDAYRQARQYVKKRLPLTTDFRHEDWSRTMPFSEEPDGTVYCHFWVREPGQNDYRHVHITMRRTLRFYWMEL